MHRKSRGQSIFCLGRRWWWWSPSAFCGRSGAGRSVRFHGSIRVILRRFSCTWWRRGTRAGRCRRRGPRAGGCRDQCSLVDSYCLVGGGTIELWWWWTSSGALWCSWNWSRLECFGRNLGCQEHGCLLTMWAGDLFPAHIRRIFNALATSRARTLNCNQNAHG